MSKTSTSSKENTSVSYADDATLWQARYRTAYNNQLPMFKRFSDWYDVMYSIVTTKNYNLWRSKVFIPILGSKAWNMISKFMSLKPGFEVRVRQSGIGSVDLGTPPDLEAQAEKATLKLEYDYDNPKLDKPIREKLLSVLTDAVVTGTGLAKVPWDLKKETRYEHPVNPDGTIDMSKEKVVESYCGYNNLIPVNIFNVFIAPSAVDLYNTPWLIIKDWKTLDQLKKVNQGKGVEIYKNLDALEGARVSGDPIAVYKKARNRLTTQIDPYVADLTVDFFEVYECYDRSTNTIITYANAGGKATEGFSNWVEIRRDKNPYWHGKYPLVRFIVKQRPYDFWGQGVFETSHRMQVAVNDIVNHYFDNMNLSLDGMLMAHESAGINDYIVEPGGLITYRTEEPKQFKFPEPNPALFNTSVQFLLGQIENDTISQYSTGNPDSEQDKTRGTKGGILALQQAADDMTAFMRMNFQESIKVVGQMWLSNNQQFMSKPLTVVVPKNHQMTPLTITPQDMQGEMELRVDEASMLPISDDQIKAQFMAFTQQLMQYQQASVAQYQMFGTPPLILAFDQIVQEAAEKNGFRNLQSFMGKPAPGPSPVQKQQAMQMAHEQQLKQAAQKPQPQQPQPTIQDKMIESLNYKDVPDDVKRQMEAQAGFHPSQSGVNSTAPHVNKANKDVLKMAQDLHAKGMLHPSVLDMVHSHIGNQVPQPTPQVPMIGPEPVGTNGQ